MQAIASGMFLDGLPKTLTPLGVGGAGAPDVQAGLRKTLRAMLDIQVRSDLLHMGHDQSLAIAYELG
jgi:hypothetical protein